jgi:hypothetical protein
MGSSQTQVSLRSAVPVFPDFLLPGSFQENLRTFREITTKAVAAGGFAPLMPLHITKRLIGNSFADMMEVNKLLDLSDFMTLLDDQYASSSLGPADNPARWAVVNAITALATRAKTAPGSETELHDITHGFYRNATRVIPELILQDPSLLSVQALLSLAIFARCIPDVQASVMLTTNASRQLEFLGLSPRLVDETIGILRVDASTALRMRL